MIILVTTETGLLFQLSREADVNDIAQRGEAAGQEIVDRFVDRHRIPGTVQDWEYKMEWEVRELTDSGVEIEYLEEYDEIEDDPYYEENERSSIFDYDYDYDLPEA